MYNILGLVINAVTGESFEAYMKNSILEPLGLNQTFLFRAEAKKCGMAVGYKIAFKQLHQYDAPVYRGNKPADYIINNAKDAAKLLKIQLGTVKLKKFDQSLVEKSHIPNPYLENAFYAKGWDVRLKKGFICHGEANPNFSSHFLFDTREKIGIGILSNIKSDLTDATAFGIYELIKGNSEKLSPAIDFNMVYDNISLTVLYITVPLILAGICFILVFTIRFGKINGSLWQEVAKVFYPWFYLHLL